MSHHQKWLITVHPMTCCLFQHLWVSNIVTLMSASSSSSFLPGLWRLEQSPKGERRRPVSLPGVSVYSVGGSCWSRVLELGGSSRLGTKQGIPYPIAHLVPPKLPPIGIMPDSASSSALWDRLLLCQVRAPQTTCQPKGPERACPPTYHSSGHTTGP